MPVAKLKRQMIISLNMPVQYLVDYYSLIRLALALCSDQKSILVQTNVFRCVSQSVNPTHLTCTLCIAIDNLSSLVLFTSKQAMRQILVRNQEPPFLCEKQQTWSSKLRQEACREV